METVNQIEYNGDLYNIQDAEAQKNLVYSQNEIDTGKIWIDGKKIYRKVIDCGALPNKSLKRVPINIVNVNEIIILTVTALSSIGDLTFLLPFINKDGSIVTVYRQGDEIILDTNLDFSFCDKTFAILEYTKTTN